MREKREQRIKKQRAESAASKKERMRHPTGKSTYATRRVRREEQARVEAKKVATVSSTPKPQQTTQSSTFADRLGFGASWTPRRFPSTAW